jgi:hypothetical protein
MSDANAIPAVILQTFLSRLAMLFLSAAGGDITAARHAASRMLAAYHPRTEDELCLAAQVISFSIHALDALGEATEPGIAPTRIVRLRGSAVSLHREADKAQRRLAQRQQARQEAIAVQPHSVQPASEPGPIEHPVAAATPSIPGQPYDRRPEDLRIAASIKRAEAIAAAKPSVPPFGLAAARPQAAHPTQQAR